MNHYQQGVRAPLKFEDWPTLFFVWRLWADLCGSFDGHYRRKGAFCGFGPTPWFYLRPSNLLNRWRVAKSRSNSRFALLTLCCHPYQDGYFGGRDTLSQDIQNHYCQILQKHRERVTQQRQELQKCGVLPKPEPITNP